MMVRFVKTRDRRLFDELFRRYRNRMVAYAGRYVRSRPQAEELAQEVFVRVYTSKKFEARATFKTWLYRVATNVCLNELRKPEHKNRIEPMENDEVESGLGGSAETPEGQLHGRETSMRLHTVLHSLPRNQQAAFTMARLEGLSHAEISEALSLSVPAVKSAIHRALEALRAEVSRLSEPDALTPETVS